MNVNVETKDVKWHELRKGDLVVVGHNVRRVQGINTQRRSVQVVLPGGGYDTFPADWFHEGSVWSVVV